MIQTGSWTVSVECHDCVTGTKRRCNQNSGWYWFCQYQEIYYKICVCVCVNVEREKERRETVGETQGHSDTIITVNVEALSRICKKHQTFQPNMQNKLTHKQISVFFKQVVL